MNETIYQAGSAGDKIRERLDRGIRLVQDYRSFFLARLARFVALREQYVGIADEDLNLARLLNKCIYSSFCDCLDLGVGEEARTILRGEGTILRAAA
jgi:hypothetical protein